MTSPRDSLGSLPDRVRVIEVGPRDGLQMEKRFVATERKVAWIDQLSAAGFEEIEVCSFVRPDVIPQMADAADVMRRIRRPEGVRMTALVPNLRGAELALAARADALRLVVAVTETYNRRNVGLSLEESAQRFGEIAELAARDDVPASVVFGVALGCPLEGEVPVDHVAALAQRYADLGAEEIGLADSYGMSNPSAVRRLIRAVRSVVPDHPLWLHLHDTRGLGLANVYAALLEGVDRFDTACGGLGGTPILKGASGNVATEDLLFLCREMGLETGIDLDRVRTVSREIQSLFVRSLPSHVLQAGTNEELMALNAPIREKYEVGEAS